MRLSELQNKNLVNVSNGKNIGNIIDVNIDYQSGNIKSFIIESKGSILTFLNKDNDMEVKWNDIQKIGEVTRDDFCILILLVSVAYVFLDIIKKIANFCSSSFINNISTRDNYHVFGIDKGDKEIQSKYEKIRNDNQNKAITSLILSIIINIICGIFSSIIATKFLL